MFMKHAVLRKTVAVLALCAMLLACKADEPTYRTEPVTRGAIRQIVTATGAVNAVTNVLVGTQISGTIKELYVDFNSRVRKGQVIALIDPSTFEMQVRQAQANLAIAQANLDKAGVAQADAKRTVDRNKELFAKNLIPRSDLDASETAHDSARAQTGAAKAQTEQATAALDLARQNLSYTRIVSPVDGIVISRNVDVGQTVAASFQTPTLFSIAQDLTKMQIDTNVAESDIGQVKVGQQVEFTVDAYPDVMFKGKVWQLRKAPITVQNVVTYDVVIQVQNNDLRLMPGMTTNASIVIQVKDNVLRVTNAALRFRFADRQSGSGNGNGNASRTAEKDAPRDGKPKGERKGPSVWTLENGKPKRIVITPGISDGVYTEIVSGELKEAQELIVEAMKKNSKQAQSGPPRMF